jgi:pyroglutamyl-peptidase
MLRRRRRTPKGPPAPQAVEPGRGRRQRPLALVTGFDAFAGESINPSWQVCERLPAEIAGARVVIQRLPCEFRRAIEVVAEAIERERPTLVICVGQAGGRAHLGVERVAINVDDARIGDNGGNRPIDEPIAVMGPAAYFATLPIKAMVHAMRASGVPAEISNSAGTFVCNHVMYGVLHYLANVSSERRGSCRAGFIHVPYSEDQVLDKPAIAAMSVATMVKGIEAAIAAAVTHEADLKLEGGALD